MSLFFNYKASKIFSLLLSILLFTACNKSVKEPVLFELLTQQKTGINFTNKLTATNGFNMFNYMYFYNGAGVGAGDFNNDGWVDLFFTANQGENKLYLNEHTKHFKDVTSQAQIPQNGSWCTGVSVVDINNDGLLDIYITVVGNYEILKGDNQLLVCQGITKEGIPFYKDEAAAYGINFSGFGTQAAFFDYDLDGDVDMYLLNHSVHHNGTFAPRSTFLNTYNSLSGDKLYKNINGKFTDVTKQSGINSSGIGYGLGISVSDINMDGYPDIYIGNYFHENDYLYINQKNGTFKEVLTEQIMHTSQFTMGVDVADINNDVLPEIISVDMLPSDPYILKRSLGEDAYDIFQVKLKNGYNYQYARNNLQFNLGNNKFSEIGRYSGIYATDWSWSPLWIDVNNDGLKDLFISNGIPKRLNDIDYVNYVSNEEVQPKIRDHKMEDKDMALIDKFPEIKLPNKFYINKGEAVFADAENTINNNLPTFSNGAVFADFDNDGDEDIVVSNIADAAMLYENKTNNAGKPVKQYASIVFSGSPQNINAIGAKVLVYTNSGIQAYQYYPVKGFQSSMQVPMHIGLENKKIDSTIIIWPNNTFQKIKLKVNAINEIKFHVGLPVYQIPTAITNAFAAVPIENITVNTNILHKHEENNFIEFDREQLIPNMLSREGPAVTIIDINNDALDDIFIGAAKGFKATIFVQKANGKFIKNSQPALDADSTYEDVNAIWIDVNKDAIKDLVVASGGNEYYGTDAFLLPRVYLNNSKGTLTKKVDAFSNIFTTQSVILPININSDAAIDLFVGSRATPFDYGLVPPSYFLQNDGTGKFIDVTSTVCPTAKNLGFITNAVVADMDKNGKDDILLSIEWGAITILYNSGKIFEAKPIGKENGWWNFAKNVDIDGDGDIDIIAGNTGLNNRLQPSTSKPVSMYYADFDGNGKKEQVVTYFLGNKEIPFANKEELQKQMPLLKKKFLYAEDFAKATLEELFDKQKLATATKYTVTNFSNTIFINNGKNEFTAIPFPWQAQLTTYKDACFIDVNNDGLLDIFPVGNYYDNNIQMGRYDADYGTVLINKGKGNFSTALSSGYNIKSQVKKIIPLKVGTTTGYLLASNNDSVVIIKFK